MSNLEFHQNRRQKNFFPPRSNAVMRHWAAKYCAYVMPPIFPHWAAIRYQCPRSQPAKQSTLGTKVLPGILTLCVILPGRVVAQPTSELACQVFGGGQFESEWSYCRERRQLRGFRPSWRVRPHPPARLRE